ncbi:unnamed protein product [Protopolystoma xenopodis]|uniref:Uncharacterized protein n=1 Tax=Protopolystoma xenopodis TaxID=117903 RepID=A0A3S4ZX09_9PLAT|nr:unnamed protein product [Protopolystoma xenopodis]
MFTGPHNETACLSLNLLVLSSSSAEGNSEVKRNLLRLHLESSWTVLLISIEDQSSIECLMATKQKLLLQPSCPYPSAPRPLPAKPINSLYSSDS